MRVALPLLLAGVTGSYITGSMVRVDGGRVRSMF